VLRARLRAQLRRKQFEDVNRRIREELLRREVETAQARAALEVAEIRASMAAELERTKFRTPAFPVIANTTARPVEGPEEIRLQLTRQVDGPTRWAESMRWCISEGCDTFLEIGPGLVLQGLLKRIDPKCRCVSIGTAAAVEGLVQATRAGNAADSCGS
jgi:malonyl CoA-acyl carrier protein transacylase